jgi:uncharacterized protein YbjQ (UPF0145 family)
MITPTTVSPIAEYHGLVAIKARDATLDEMQAHPSSLGAKAVAAVDRDCEVINKMLMVSAGGTAVRLQ